MAGTETVRQLASVENPPMIFGMIEDLQTVSRAVMRVHLKNTEELIQGDATNTNDIHRALWISRADTIVLCIDDSKRKRTNSNHNVRAETARALVQVLRHHANRHVHLIVISSSTAALSEARGEEKVAQTRPSVSYLMNVGKVADTKRQRDFHALEEIVFSEHTIQARTTIVRAAAPSKTSTIPGVIGKGGRVVSGALVKMEKQLLQRYAGGRYHKTERDEEEKIPQKTKELARYVVNEVIGGQNKGLVVNIPIITCQ